MGEGGRTGLTSVVTAVWFFISIIFAPILASFPPWTTGFALVLVGATMMRSLVKIDWEDPQETLPAFLCIIVMPLRTRLRKALGSASLPGSSWHSSRRKRRRLGDHQKGTRLNPLRQNIKPVRKPNPLRREAKKDEAPSQNGC